MKKSILILIVILAIPALSQQDRFIIGAEHVSSTHDFWDPQNIPHSDAYWNTVQSLGLNYVGLKYFQRYSTYGNATADQIRDDLQKANDRNIEVYLTNGFDRDAAGNTYYPKRWLYQIENPTNVIGGNSVNDFSNVLMGTSNTHDNNASTHWNLAPDFPQSALNFLHLRAGSSGGIVANSLRLKNLQPDKLDYYLKIRMRLPDATSFPNVNVVTVRVKAGGTFAEGTIKASDIGTNNWLELPVTSFFKDPWGPGAYVSGVRDSSVYNFTDTIGTVQLANYSVKEDVTYSDYDIEIEFYGPNSFDVDLDYVAIDDETAERVYNGDFDARVVDFANQYKNHAAMRDFVIWDEPYVENFLPVQRYKTVLNLPTNRNPMTYWAQGGRPDNYTKRFLHETGMPILLADRYPIPYYYENTTTPFVIPGDVDYTSELQLRLQGYFIPALYDLVSNSISFNKPFWLGVQAHKWAVSPDEMRLREPSAYEIRVMANLGVCYGAKGIIYYMYTKYADGLNDRLGLLDDGSVPRYTDNYGYPKWQTVTELNQKLAAIGNVLLSLTWQGAKSWSNSATWGAGPGPVTGIVTNISGETKYVESGHFKNGATDYIFVVNRRTLTTESRDITLTLNNSASSEILDVASGNTWIIPSNGSFTDNFQPGEGKLYKIGPATWSGTKNIVSTVTVPSNVTLTIDPGTTVKIEGSSTNLEVYGTLCANGTTQSPITFSAKSGTSPGSWGSIEFWGNGASSSVLNNVAMEYGVDVRCLNGADVTIENSLLQNNFNGVICYYSSPVISGNVINPQYHGIYADHSDPIIGYNTISKPTSGIAYHYNCGLWLKGSSPGIGHNVIEGFEDGLLVEEESDAQFWLPILDTPYPNNLVKDNLTGLNIRENSYVWMGVYSAGADAWYGGFNSIQNNLSYDMFVSERSEVYAAQNYWGQDLAPYTWVEPGSVFDWSDALDYDPWGGGMIVTQGGGGVGNELSSNHHHITSVSTSQKKPITSNPDIDDLLKALKLRKLGQLGEAQDIYKDLLLKEGTFQIALIELANLFKESGDESVLEFFKGLRTDASAFPLSSQKRPLVSALLAGMHVKRGENSNAKQLYDEIIAENPGTSYERKAWFQKLFLSLYLEKDKNAATQIMDQITSKYHDGLDVEFARDELARATGMSSPSGAATNLPAVLSKKASASQLPDHFELSANYPNPFNPRTTIRFATPTDNFVTLKVYDILGKEVATLANEERPVGFYEVRFDASHLSSGIYFYQIQAGSFREVKKMLLMK